jgi:hypothetical protein
MENTDQITDFITVTVDGVEYADVVRKDYRYDPETEDLIYGEELKDGMVVLCDVVWRSNENDPWEDRALLVKNRRCTVTKKRHQGSSLYFIGLYDDGTKAVRQSGPTNGWIVKKDSLPPAPTMIMIHDTPSALDYRPSKAVVALALITLVTVVALIWSLYN